ncbi:DUF7426 family protein [Streptomyces mobaraensis]|uniref:DUF7426 domain-containing protein n=1 Tax=Streptomyces mobaraensis TaxID=35621 RepID=A0A5N5W0C3_STRMB|nr:hypothetical protein [Streptomyces mobaraensis]KAB7834067.1 hypothetical protein FRZ00_30875 [Streptomyces mobaraensis]
MAFEALGELLDESLHLPVGDRTYTIPAPSAEVGLRVQAIVHAAAAAADGGKVDDEVLADAAEHDLYRDVLGSAYDEMVSGGVSWPALKHAAITGMVWIAQDKDAAARYWSTGGDPSRMAPNRETRRAAQSGAASSIPSRGSTSGTSTRPAPDRSKGRRRR